MGFTTYKNRFNMRYGFPRNESHSINDIARITGYKLPGLNTIVAKGQGAYFSNRASVRPQVKSPLQWGIARLYASLDKSSKAYQVDKTHLIKK